MNEEKKYDKMNAIFGLFDIFCMFEQSKDSFSHCVNSEKLARKIKYNFCL